MKFALTIICISSFLMTPNQQINSKSSKVIASLYINDDSLKDPFKELSYDEVFMYNFNYDTAKKQRLNMEFTATNFNFHKVKKTSLRKLDSSAVVHIIETLTDTATYGAQNYACFLPRMGISFLKTKKPVFNVLICLECNYLESTSKIPAMFHSSYKLYPDDAPPITLYNMGFSDKGKKALLEICSKSGLGFCKNE